MRWRTTRIKPAMSKQSHRFRCVYVLIILGLFLLYNYYAAEINGHEQTQFDVVDSTEEYTTPEDGTLSVSFIDVDQGASTLLIQTDENGKATSMLVDTGQGGAYSAVKSTLEQYSIKRLDYLVITHMDADHMGNAYKIFNDYDVETFVSADNLSKGTGVVRKLADCVSKLKKDQIMFPETGDSFKLGDATVQVLAPLINTDGAYSDSNEYSLVTKVIYGDTSFLLTGDATGKEYSQSLDKVSPSDYKADVLLLMHHGSANHGSNSYAFLDTVKPYWAVISCGKDNDYGHPHIETVNALKDLNIQVFRTDKQGTFTGVSDGTSIKWDKTPCNDYSRGSRKE